MSEFDAVFKSIIDHAFGDEHDAIELDLIAFNRLSDRLGAWKGSKSADDRDFARWMISQMIKNLAELL